MDASTGRRRSALFLLYSLPGFALASFVTRTPAVRDLLDASTTEMGLLLLGLSIGSMVGILVSSWLVRRAGTRAVLTWGGLA